MVLLASVGVVWILRSQAWKSESLYSLGGLWAFGLLVLYGLVAPCVSGYYTRYTTPLIPIVMIFGALGGQKLVEWAGEKVKRRGHKPATTLNSDQLAQILLFEGLALALIPTLFFWAPYYAQSVLDIQTMHLQIGEWLAEHSRPEEVIALNDVGAIGSIAGREVIDLMGLTTPEVLTMVEGKAPGEWDLALTDYLLERRPAYLVVFPNWFPKLITNLPLEPVFQVQLPPRSISGIPQITVAGGGKMVVYRFHWENPR